MNSTVFNKNKNYLLSNNQLIGFMIDIGSKFVDLLVEAFKDKKMNKHNLIINNGKITKKNSPINEIINILHSYNIKLKKNYELYKEKNIENSKFLKEYKYLKLYNSNFTKLNNDNPEKILEDIIELYKEKKNYSFSKMFLSKNIFNESPLLILGNEKISRFFQKDLIINNLQSISSTKTILFLKRVLEDVVDLYKTFSSLIPKTLMKKNENILRFNHIKKQKEELMLKINERKKNIFQINQSKKDIDTLLNLINIQDEKQKKKKNEFNNSVILNYKKYQNLISNYEPQNEISLSYLPSISPNIILNKTQNEISKYNLYNNNFPIKGRNPINLKSMFFYKNKKLSSTENSSSTKILECSKNTINESFSYLNINTQSENKKTPKSERKKIKRLDLLNIYNQLKNKEKVLRNKYHNQKTRKYLSLIYDDNKINNYNIKEIPSEIHRNFSYMRRIVNENIPEKIIKIYKKRVPDKINNKIENVIKLDNEINKIDKDFIKIVLNHKILNSDSIFKPSK